MQGKLREVLREHLLFPVKENLRWLKKQGKSKSYGQMLIHKDNLQSKGYELKCRMTNQYKQNQ